MQSSETADKLHEFKSRFTTLVHNREKVPLPELRSIYAKAYNALVAEVVSGADWYAGTVLRLHPFPTHPADFDGNNWLTNRLARMDAQDAAPGGAVEQYRAALIDRLSMREFKEIAWERYGRRCREVFAPYWQRHCFRLTSGWIYNDIFRKFWLPSESGKSGGWINSDYSGRDGRFPPQMKEDNHGKL